MAWLSLGRLIHSRRRGLPPLRFGGVLAAPGERRMIGEVTAGELGTSGMRRTLGR